MENYNPNQPKQAAKWGSETPGTSEHKSAQEYIRECNKFDQRAAAKSVEKIRKSRSIYRLISCVIKGNKGKTLNSLGFEKICTPGPPGILRLSKMKIDINVEKSEPALLQIDNVEVLTIYLPLLPPNVRMRVEKINIDFFINFFSLQTKHQHLLQTLQNKFKINVQSVFVRKNPNGKYGNSAFVYCQTNTDAARYVFCLSLLV